MSLNAASHIYVTPAKAGVHRVSPRKLTGEIVTSLRWCDGSFQL